MCKLARCSKTLILLPGFILLVLLSACAPVTVTPTVVPTETPTPIPTPTPVPPAAAMGVFPMVLVPAFAVPISVMLHVFALGGVLREIRFPRGLVPKPAR